MSKFWKYISICIGVIVLLLVILAVTLYVLTARGVYTGMRNNTPFEEAHSKAVYTFVNSKGFGISRFRHRDTWNEYSVDFANTKHQVFAVSLVGLTPEYGERYYESSRLPMKAKLVDHETRVLTAKELTAIEEIREGKEKYVRLAAEDTGLTRVLAPLHATKSCIKCHSVDEGDLLGVFDYQLLQMTER